MYCELGSVPTELLDRDAVFLHGPSVPVLLLRAGGHVLVPAVLRDIHSAAASDQQLVGDVPRALRLCDNQNTVRLRFRVYFVHVAGSYAF